MKKLLLSIFTLGSIGLAGAQTFAIYDYGTSTDISGTTITFIADGITPYDGHLTVENISGAPLNVKIRRTQIDNFNSVVSEQVCWGPVPDPSFLGTCIDFNSTDSWWSTPAAEMNDQNVGDVKIHIAPTMSSSGAHYRYYIEGTDANHTRYDSVDVRINSVAAVKEAKNVSFSVYPNPATDLITLNVQGTGSDNTVKLIDVLGNVVFEDRMGATKKIDVSTFKNGVYILSVYNSGSLMQTKRIVVRH